MHQSDIVRRPRARAVAALVLAALLHVVSARPASAVADPALVGQWLPPRKWPAVAVHLVMLKTGKVLFFRGDQSVPTAYQWDPATEAVTSIPIGLGTFCSGEAFLPDGRVLVVGGAIGTTT